MPRNPVGAVGAVDAVSSISGVLNNWAEHNAAISGKLDDLACVLLSIETAITGPKPANPREEPETTPDTPPNFAKLLHNSATLRGRLSDLLVKLHDIAD